MGNTQGRREGVSEYVEEERESTRKSRVEVAAPASYRMLPTAAWLKPPVASPYALQPPATMLFSSHTNSSILDAVMPPPAVPLRRAESAGTAVHWIRLLMTLTS